MIKEMDTFMLLVCTYGCSTTVINVARAMCYSRLVECLCEKWDELSTGSISLFYKLPGINKCHLDNEEEFQNMVLLAKSMGVQHVEVVVELKGDICQSSSLGLLRVGVEDEIDALRRFCHHKEKVLLSAPWANGITHVGQRFVGGAQEFRDVLCKYAIQCGFKFTYVKNETTRVTAVCAMREERGCLWAIHCRAQ
ncbi:uncharacterized protein LOC114299767 [Camellia sinensis]|uniref:uncharacterized protein LOC114299767 n=1 Tax=Camellia sinensis TaxID=4442 RepID=UPI0010363579|nr:uncharacterized protein LOC114299767 [Camellia sinensis]